MRSFDRVSLFFVSMGPGRDKSERTGFGNTMKCLGWMSVLAGLLGALPVSSQVLTNQYLNGKYYLRQVSLLVGADGQTQAQSLLATATFDGAGGFSFTGQRVI